MDIQEIVRLHPKSVAASFKKIGVHTAQVTPKDLTLVTLLHGHKFIDTLANEVEQETLAGYTGYGGPLFLSPQSVHALNEHVAQAQGSDKYKNLPEVVVKAKRKGEKLKNTLNDIFSIAANAFGAYRTARTQGSSNSPAIAYPGSSSQEPNPKNKFILIGAIVLILTLVVVLVMQRKN